MSSTYRMSFFSNVAVKFFLLLLCQLDKCVIYTPCGVWISGAWISAEPSTHRLQWLVEFIASTFQFRDFILSAVRLPYLSEHMTLAGIQSAFILIFHSQWHAISLFFWHSPQFDESNNRENELPKNTLKLHLISFMPICASRHGKRDHRKDMRLCRNAGSKRSQIKH